MTYHNPYEITDADIAQMLFDDFTFPARGAMGAPQWYPSADVISNNHCRGLIYEEKLAKCAAQTPTQAFVIERRFDGERLKKSSALGSLFYQTLAIPRPPANPKHYEPSVYHQVMTSVAKAQNFGAIQLMGKPLARVTADGLLEGEAINSFLTRVGEILNCESARERIKGRMAQFNSRLLKINRYFERHAKTLAYPLVQETRLFYFAANNPPAVERSLAHVAGFVADLQADRTLTPEGFFWKRQHCTEAGDNYRFLAIYDANKLHCGQAPNSELCALWRQKTEGLGLGVPTRTFKFDKKALKKHLRLMFLRDMTLQLKSPETLPTFATGVLPKLVKSEKKFTVPAAANFTEVSSGEKTQPGLRLDVAGPSVWADLV